MLILGNQMIMLSPYFSICQKSKKESEFVPCITLNLAVRRYELASGSSDFGQDCAKEHWEKFSAVSITFLLLHINIACFLEVQMARKSVQQCFIKILNKSFASQTFSQILFFTALNFSSLPGISNQCSSALYEGQLPAKWSCLSLTIRYSMLQLGTVCMAIVSQFSCCFFVSHNPDLS